MFACLSLKHETRNFNFDKLNLLGHFILHRTIYHTILFLFDTSNSRGVARVCTAVHHFIVECNLCSGAVLFRALLHHPDLNCRVTQITDAERETEIGPSEGIDERTISETIRPSSFVIKRAGSPRLVAAFLIFPAILPPAVFVFTTL